MSFYSLPTASNSKPRSPFRPRSKSRSKVGFEKFYKAKDKVRVEKETENKDNDKDNLLGKCL